MYMQPLLMMPLTNHILYKEKITLMQFIKLKVMKLPDEYKNFN